MNGLGCITLRRKDDDVQRRLGYDLTVVAFEEHLGIRIDSAFVHEVELARLTGGSNAKAVAIDIEHGPRAIEQIGRCIIDHRANAGSTAFRPEKIESAGVLNGCSRITVR